MIWAAVISVLLGCCGLVFGSSCNEGTRLTSNELGQHRQREFNRNNADEPDGCGVDDRVQDGEGHREKEAARQSVFGLVCG